MMVFFLSTREICEKSSPILPGEQRAHIPQVENNFVDRKYCRYSMNFHVIKEEMSTTLDENRAKAHAKTHRHQTRAHSLIREQFLLFPKISSHTTECEHMQPEGGKRGEARRIAAHI
jgi:hypothetical protein